MKENIIAQSTLDTSGKCCPMPMVNTNKAMRSLVKGDILEIIATDPGTQSDIPSWCKRTSNELLGSYKENKTFKYYIKKS